MTWDAANETVPVPRDKVLDALNEVVAAVNERRTAIMAVGWDEPYDVAGAVSMLVAPVNLEDFRGKIDELRDRIQNIAPYFCDPDRDFRPFNSSGKFAHPDGNVDLWAATFGKEKDADGVDTSSDRSNWMNVSWKVSGIAPRPVYASNTGAAVPINEWHYITELRDTLNGMVWLVHKVKNAGEPNKDGYDWGATRAEARVGSEADLAADEAQFVWGDPGPPYFHAITGGMDFGYGYDAGRGEYHCGVVAGAETWGWVRGFGEVATANHAIGGARAFCTVYNWLDDYDSTNSTAPGGNSWTPKLKVGTTGFGDFRTNPDAHWDDGGTDVWNGGPIAGGDHHAVGNPRRDIFDLSPGSFTQNTTNYLVLHGCDYANDNAGAYDNVENKDWDGNPGSEQLGEKRISLSRLILKYDFEYR